MAHKQNRNYQNKNKPPFKETEEFKIFKKNHESWIKEDFKPETIDFCEAFGKYLVEGRLTTSQIRNIYAK